MLYKNVLGWFFLVLGALSNNVFAGQADDIAQVNQKVAMLQQRLTGFEHGISEHMLSDLATAYLTAYTTFVTVQYHSLSEYEQMLSMTKKTRAFYTSLSALAEATGDSRLAQSLEAAERKMIEAWKKGLRLVYLNPYYALNEHVGIFERHFDLIEKYADKEMKEIVSDLKQALDRLSEKITISDISVYSALNHERDFEKAHKELQRHDHMYKLHREVSRLLIEIASAYCRKLVMK